jgi:hypothetical protein
MRDRCEQPARREGAPVYRFVVYICVARQDGEANRGTRVFCSVADPLQRDTVRLPARLAQSDDIVCGSTNERRPIATRLHDDQRNRSHFSTSVGFASTRRSKGISPFP